MTKRRGLFGSAPSYDTPLDAEQEKRFTLWAQQSGRLGDVEDYDLRGAWLSNPAVAANGHLPDTYKKPNHPTFSDESEYSAPASPGGHWSGRDDDPNWVFSASPLNLRYRTAMQLAEYFRQNEPQSTLILPFNYRLPGR